MTIRTLRNRGVAAASLLVCLGIAASPATAAPLVTTVNADLSAAPFTISFLGNSFIFNGTGSFPNYLSVATTGDAAVRTVFGTPSTDFTNRGTVIYDQNTLGGYGAFASSTAIPYTNGDNYLGLRVNSGGQNYYGFLFSTDTTLNSFGFESVANTGINPTTALAAAAVPEPASWMMMIGGFGLLGATLRHRRTALRFA